MKEAQKERNRGRLELRKGNRAAAGLHTQNAMRFEANAIQ